MVLTPHFKFPILSSDSFSENMCEADTVWARSEASPQMVLKAPPCLTMCCCAVHSSTLDWGRRTRLFLSQCLLRPPHGAHRNIPPATRASAVTRSGQIAEWEVAGRNGVFFFVRRNYIPVFFLFFLRDCSLQATPKDDCFFLVAPCALQCICSNTEPIFQAMSLEHTWGRLADMSR